MRILYVVHGFGRGAPGGTEQYAYRLTTRAAESEEVFVFTRFSDPSEGEFSLRRTVSGRVTVFAINNTFRDCRNFRQTYDHPSINSVFASVLEETRPDIAHFQSFLYMSAGMALEAKKRGIPVVFTLNDYWMLCPQGQFFRNDSVSCEGGSNAQCRECVMYQLGIKKNIAGFYSFLRALLPDAAVRVLKDLYLVSAGATFLSGKKASGYLSERKAFLARVSSVIDLFIAPSLYIKRIFSVSGVPDGRIVYAKYGFERYSAGGKRCPAEYPLVFGYIGNLIPAKGLRVLIEAFKVFEPHQAKLAVYGQESSYKGSLSGYSKKIRASAGKNVDFMGVFDHTELSSVMAGIDVLVVPSIWQENAPLVIQEAFHAGVPVIASNIGGIPELVRDGMRGFLFEPGNVEDLREKIYLVIENPAVISEWKKNLPPAQDIDSHFAFIKESYARLTGKSEMDR